MQIVIDIPESTLNWVSTDTRCLSDKEFQDIVHAFQNCKRLPKGHGRLIDVDALIEKLEIGRDCDVCEKNSTLYCCWNPNAVDVCEAISDALTIIEADKAESEGKE